MQNRTPVDLNAAPLSEQAPDLADRLAFTFEGVAIVDPWHTVDMRGPAHPRDYGFRLEQTGGGCTAWTLEQDGIIYMVTEREDAIAPETPANGWALGAYPEETYLEGVGVLLEVGPDGRGAIWEV